MNEELIVVCPACETEIPARRARLVRVACPGCGQRYEINYEWDGSPGDPERTA